MVRTDLTSRYIQLVEELGDQLGHEHGWQRRVADQLGIDHTALSKILSGNRKVGWELAQRAVHRLNLDPRYFSGGRARRRGPVGAANEAASELDDLVTSVRAGTATTQDVYALARMVADNPTVAQARAILRMKRPRTEQQIGSLFLAASKLIDLLDSSGPSRK